MSQLILELKNFAIYAIYVQAECPVKAIPFDPPSDNTYNQSNISGVRKWSVDGEKCFSFWTAQNSDCSICIRVCPYNKDYSKWNKSHCYETCKYLASKSINLD